MAMQYMRHQQVIQEAQAGMVTIHNFLTRADRFSDVEETILMVVELERSIFVPTMVVAFTTDSVQPYALRLSIYFQKFQQGWVQQRCFCKKL